MAANQTDLLSSGVAVAKPQRLSNLDHSLGEATWSAKFRLRDDNLHFSVPEGYLLYYYYGFKNLSVDFKVSE